MTTDIGTAIAFAPGQRLAFDYVNWRGERATRVADAVSLRHGATEWHPEPQWLVLARDIERGADREFALADMIPAEGARLLFVEGQRADMGHGGRLGPLSRPGALRFASSATDARPQWVLDHMVEEPGASADCVPIRYLVPIVAPEDAA